MIELTHGDNPLYFADTFVHDDEQSFTEVYWLERLDETYVGKLEPLYACAAEDCPMTLLVFGVSTLSDDETFKVRRLLSTHGIQTCFRFELDDWKASAL